MSALRHLLLVAFFVGLAALEIAHGIHRLDAVRDRSRAELLGTTIARGQADLAGRLRGLFEGQRDHASHLSSMAALRRFLAEERRAASERREGDAGAISDGGGSREHAVTEARRELEGQLLAHLVAFRGIDRVRVLDPEGRERVRCERIGSEGGVGAIPGALLRAEPDEAILALARPLAPGEVVRTPLAVDHRRVEVPPSERQVFHFVAAVTAPPPRAERLGSLVLTVYASPLLGAVRQFAPIDGIASYLVDAEGNYLAHSARWFERPGGGDLRSDHPGVAAALLGGAARAEEGTTHFLSTAVGDQVGWRFIVEVPDTALDAAAGDPRAEYLRIGGSVLLVTLVLAAATIFFVRLSQRAVRLEEERRQQDLERRLRISERLGALGLITAGVAHEINNPLEGIGNYLSLLEKDGLPPEKRREHLEQVRHGFRRIRDIVRDLSSVSRPAQGDAAVDLARVVERALALASYDPRFRGVEVEVDVAGNGAAGPGGPLEVSGDAGRLEQVLLNLLLNAGQAMRGAGRVRVAARRLEGREHGWIEVAIEDTGPGIDPEHLEHLFEPFFTTAEGSEGTGLGLAISRGIVTAHGGTITAENRTEGGARFLVRLPAGGARRGEP